MISELFSKLNEIDSSSKSAVLTVTDGNFFGQKALISDDKLVWESETNGFFSVHKNDLHMRASTGNLLIGGQKVFCDCISSPKELIICGGGHVSTPIIKMGRMLGFLVTVLEDRPYFADMARRAEADNVICKMFDEGLKEIPGSQDSYFVIVTRGHRYDQLCLETILRKEYAYLGMMGSRSRVALVREHMLEKGFSKEKVDTLHSPIGLSIRAETPAEIAVSVMAEIVQEKNRQKRMSGYSKEIMEAIVDRDDKEDKSLLVTIVNRRGSAPRAVGTKMLVKRNGATSGTIGGGCMEAEVIRKALQMLNSGNEETLLYNVNMSGEEAEEEGMACGGDIDVLLETV